MKGKEKKTKAQKSGCIFFMGQKKRKGIRDSGRKKKKTQRLCWGRRGETSLPKPNGKRGCTLTEEKGRGGTRASSVFVRKKTWEHRKNTNNPE